MGGSTVLVWRGKKAIKDPPEGFRGDSRAWAQFVTAMQEEQNLEAREALKDLGLGILLESTAEYDDDAGRLMADWQTPFKLETAASIALALLAAKDPRLDSVVRVYGEFYRGLVTEEIWRKEFAGDLEDIAGMARWAEKAGLTKIAFEISW